MKKRKVLCSEKQILSIAEFMENYIGKKYDGQEKLTHREMCRYLDEKGMNIPIKINFAFVDKESLLKGEYLVVKDKNTQIIIYKNPRTDLSTLLEQLQAQRYYEEEEKVKVYIKK